MPCAMHLDHDVVIVHDPQPLPLIRHFARRRHGSGAATSISRVQIPNYGRISHH